MSLTNVIKKIKEKPYAAGGLIVVSCGLHYHLIDIRDLK